MLEELTEKGRTMGSVRERRRELCRLIEEDQLGVVEGCRQIVALLAELGEDDRGSPDLGVIIVVESDTSSSPIGAARALWSEDALKQKDRDLAEVSMAVKEACRRLQHFEPGAVAVRDR